MTTSKNGKSSLPKPNDLAAIRDGGFTGPVRRCCVHASATFTIDADGVLQEELSAMLPSRAS